MKMDKKLESVTDFLKALSWIKIVQTLIFLTIIGFFYAVWENRVVVYNSIKVGARYESSEPLILALGKESSEYIGGIAEKSREMVAGIHIVSVDFKKNSRIITHSYITDDNLRISFKNFLDNKIAPTPLFTENESNNQRVINLINGEFVCVPFQESLAGILFKGSTTVTTVCSISIPPYYGRFSGYMNVYLKKMPTDHDIITIRQIARDISLRIYETDINKSLQYITE